MRISRFVRAGGLASVVLAGALALAGCAGAPPAPDIPQNPAFYQNLAKGGQVDGEAAALLLSDYRKGRGLSAVTVDPVLTDMARKQAQLMASKDELSHAVGGRTFNMRLKAAGFDGLKAVENVGAGYHTLAEAFSGWRDSPAHNKNMLLPGATRIGIATALAPKSKYKVYWALVLAVPDPRAGQPTQGAALPPGGGPNFVDAGPPGSTSVTLNGAPLPQGQ
ncbi:CAP domain-containing protein [Ancylobacter sp. 6x-1]|uniref:CAP domain-containing protein n=1 Tax=Ancylobacter crimeensis TaxID=2579147 RepID=A0ABT0DDL0_9HYPH|nr:CAP domain-containing protein [Ancylobacter crimeensis]MCK0198053.1 CAP domain-containing protein [Ancylobacter crimeensis]